MNMREKAQMAGINYNTVRARLSRGWSESEALTVRLQVDGGNVAARSLAQQKGRVMYDGFECVIHGTTERYVKSNNCVKCQKEAYQRYQLKKRGNKNVT